MLNKYKVTIYTMSYKKDEIIECANEEELHDLIIHTNLFLVNGERARGYFYNEIS